MAHSKPKRLHKSALVNIRMTARFKQQVTKEARRDAMDVSTWIRLVVAQEIVAREDERKGRADTTPREKAR